MKIVKKKLKSLKEIKEIAKKLKLEGKKIVTANGCFDIVHIGHIRALSEAKSLGDVLIVGINSDKSIKQIKGPNRPINKELERAELLANLESVDYVVIFKEKLPINFIKSIKPNVHCKSEGQYNKKNMPEWEVVEKLGGEIHLTRFLKKHSSTNKLDIMNEN